MRQGLPTSDDMQRVTDTLSPEDAEAYLRRRLTGRSMIFELGLDEAEFRRLRKPLFAALRQHKVPALRQQFPALLATYMSLAGTFLYEGGEYWSHLHPWLQGQDGDAATQWLIAVRRLGLEPFDRIVTEERALRWVSRILAQGGIPRSCLEPFAELVTKEVDAGAADGAELLAGWRTQSVALSALHQPTRRFLLYGGGPATDLVDRCVELLRDRARLGRTPAAHEVGLPPYVVEAFERIDTPARRAQRRGQGSTSVPRPTVLVDPYDGLGPRVLLPAVPAEHLGGVWRIEAQGRVVRVEPSSYAAQIVRTEPVAFVDSEFLSSEGVRRRWSFELLSSHTVLFFDPPTRSLVRHSGHLAADEIWALVAAAARVTDAAGTDVRTVQELPAPLGAWGGFKLLHLDLDGVTQLVIDQGMGSRAVIGVAPAGARPALTGRPIKDVSADGDIPVYAEVPSLAVPGAAGLPELSVHVRGQEWDRSALLDPRQLEGPWGLEHLLPERPFGVFRVRVRGALGSDVVERFAVLPELEIERPEGVVMPNDKPPRVAVRAPGVRVGRSDPGERVEVVLEDGPATSAVMRVSDDRGRELQLNVRVPRLLWAVVHDGKPAVHLDTAVQSVDAEEFDDHLTDSLLVSVGRADVTLQLRLCDRYDVVLAELPAISTPTDGGRWAFDLGPLASAIRASDGSRLSLRMAVGGREVRVAEITSGAQAHRVVAEVGEERVRVRFDQRREVPDRVVRFWSEVEPWAPPVESPVPDGQTEVDVLLDDRLQAGPYLVEIAVDDPWALPRRPSPLGSATRRVHLGEKERLRKRLDELDPGDPRSLITWALAKHRGETTFDIAELESAAGEVAISFRSLLEATPLGASSGQRFASLASLVTARDRILVRVLAEGAEHGLENRLLDRFALRMSEHMNPTADPLDNQLMSAAWRAAPSLAAELELPWAAYDEVVRDRCRLQLGWDPASELPDPGGGRVRQLELKTPGEQLRDIRFVVGLTPSGLLDPQTRQLATFDWLLAQTEADLRGSEDGPRVWYQRHRDLLALDRVDVPHSALEDLRRFLDARRRPYGTEEWADVSALLLAAAATYRWGGDRFAGLRALEDALEWGHRTIRSDAVLLVVLERRGGAT